MRRLLVYLAGDPIGNLEQLGVVVVHEEDRHVLLVAHLAHEVQDLRRLPRSHGGRRLVEEQDLGP